jgi:hypothetical protein
VGTTNRQSPPPRPQTNIATYAMHIHGIIYETTMADEEFADIDWSSVVDPTTQQVGCAAITGIDVVDDGNDNNNAAFVNQNNNQQHFGYQNHNNHDVLEGTMMPQQQPMTTTMTEPMSSLSVHHQQQPPQQSVVVDDIESLRSQIIHLQNQLDSKDEMINDLQNTAASSQLESSHRIKTAEEEAKRKIHLVQEELRRVKIEADKYKGGWLRSKKRVTELESNSGGGKTINRVSHDGNNQENNAHLSAFGFPTDIETRRVTPSNLFGNQEKITNESAHTTSGQQLFESDTTAVSGSKRKMMEPTPLFDVGLTTASTRSLVSQTIFQYESQNKYDTVTQRLARHLITRDEMGCYSLTHMEQLLLNESADGAHTQATANIKESKGEGEMWPSETLQHSLEQSIAKGEEMRSHVRSILYQVADTDSTFSYPSDFVCRYLSSSGIFFILMTRLNALFHNDKISGGWYVPSVSVLHILRVMCDILMLSTNARDDVRYWLYQSQQPQGSDYEQKSNTGSSISVQSRIEGLPSNQIKLASNDSKEALWTPSCRATMTERGNEWDEMTMSQLCHAFFGILVDLMKGSACGSSSFDLESKVNMVLLIREQAIRLALTLVSDAPPLMSDAPPYIHTESVGRTPYLWKFWFDSLFPTNSSSAADTENETGQIEDFFSLWEVADGRGSGRKRCIRPVGEVSKSSKQKRSENGTFHSYRRDAIAEQQEQLSVKIKCGIMQILTHLLVSSSSVQQAMYQPTKSESLPLARRILAAVLDELDGSIVPLLSSSRSKAETQSIQKYLQLSYSCNEFVLALSRSNEGIHIIRYQMRVESDKDQQTHWSHSTISCLALVLHGVLSCAIRMEEEGFTPVLAANMTPYLNGIAEQCVAFFKTLQSFAHNQKRNTSKSSKSKPPTFASLISEQHLVLLSSFQTLITREQTADTVSGTSCLLWISDKLKYDVQVMMEEAMYDEV